MSIVLTYQLAGQRGVLGCPPGLCRSGCTSLRSRCSGFGACKSVKSKGYIITNTKYKIDYHYQKAQNLFVKKILSGISYLKQHNR